MVRPSSVAINETGIMRVLRSSCGLGVIGTKPRAGVTGQE